MSVLGLGVGTAGIAQGKDGSDLMSPCHSWVHLLVARCCSSQAGDRVIPQWLLQGLLAFGLFIAFFSGADCHPTERPTLLHGLWGRVVLMTYCWWCLGSCPALSHHTLASYPHRRVACPHVVYLCLSLFIGNWER